MLAQLVSSQTPPAPPLVSRACRSAHWRQAIAPSPAAHSGRRPLAAASGRSCRLLPLPKRLLVQGRLLLLQRPPQRLYLAPHLRGWPAEADLLACMHTLKA
eukprot:SM000046S16426  [mRNA]  locus=s46:487249:487901:+ [translate_table: standard]